MGEEEVEDMNERIAQEEVELAAMEIQELPPPEEPGELQSELVTPLFAF